MKYAYLRKICAFLSVILAITVCLSGCGEDSGDEEAQAQKDYYSAKISYPGPAGSHSQEACEQYFNKKGEYIPYKTVTEAVEALTSGECDYAVIPQENSVDGIFSEAVDILISTKALSIEGEVELTIKQNLLVLPGTELDDIKTVYSDKQGFDQSREWLAENLPDAKLVEVPGSADGAKKVSKSKEKNCAAIASVCSSRLYSLNIIEANIQKNNKNKTRFYVLSMEAPSIQRSGRLVFIASGNAEDLPSLITRIKDQDLVLVAIHDRPLRTSIGEYNYLIECADGGYRDYEKLIKNSPFTFRFLGCYNAP